MSNRRIKLYIDGQQADMDASSLVVFNYTASDLSSPAAVKNSYSQQATLPATAANDRIFSAIYRADWRAGATSFNPLIRTPFGIYDETGALLESGYLKLNTVKKKNGVRTYGVTLYGGLGSFFYSLAYDAEGNGLSLGDLPLLSDDPTEKIDFKINAETVAAAWARLKSKSTATQDDRQFDVVNFAPAYNGLPAGEFDASKGVGQPGIVGGRSTLSERQEDGTDKVYKTYGPNEDALYDFGADFTEWEMKDLRSYLQRPVVSIRGLVEGIARYAAAQGFTLDLDPAWFSDANPYYNKAWMTLKLLAGRAVPTGNKVQTLPLTGLATSTNVADGTSTFIPIPLAPTISASKANVTVKCKPVVIFQTPSILAEMWFNYMATSKLMHNTYLGSVVFVQVQLLNAKGSVIDASPVKVCLGNYVYTPGQNPGRLDLSAQQLAEKAGLEGCIMNDYGVDTDPYMGPAHPTYYSTPEGLERYYAFDAIGPVEVSAYDAVAARIVVEPRVLYLAYGTAGREVQVLKDALSCADNKEIVGNTAPTRYAITKLGGTVSAATLEYSYPSDEYRSGVPVTQQALFADTMSPMDFLLSYTKTFGLHYVYDRDRKRVQIVTRNTLYGNRKIVDLQQRIDRSREIVTAPIPMSAKWLEFAPDTVEGEFAQYYKSRYGREYGIQKVNTGYDFDANTTQVMDAVKFNGAPEVLECSKYYLYVILPAVNKPWLRIPAPMIDGTTTYKLYYQNGSEELESTELTLTNPLLEKGSQLRYFNANKGYDGVPKLQCHGEDNSGTDGDAILLFHRGLASADPTTVNDPTAAQAYNGFIITDDSGAMYDLAGKPCWELSTGKSAVDMPAFGRFLMDGDIIRRSMEFGVPSEIDNPVIGLDNNTSVYERCWDAYISDRNDVNTRTCTAYVDLRGMQPGPEMLRDFYYFDGALWVMNKIVNYSLSTPGTTQCEFVKVQEQEHYTAGQLLDAPTYELTLSLTTDGSNLYIRTSRPLANGELVKILTRGSGRCYNKLGIPNLSKHHRSQKRWHVPKDDPLFPVDTNGKIGGMGSIGKWSIKIDKNNRQRYCHIYKANWSRGFGYKAVEGLNKAVTFAVCIYRSDGRETWAISNRCYFESRCHIRNGTLTQEFVTPE